jgi:hypothetical protein
MILRVCSFQWVDSAYVHAPVGTVWRAPLVDARMHARTVVLGGGGVDIAVAGATCCLLAALPGNEMRRSRSVFGSGGRVWVHAGKTAAGA